MNTQSLLPNIYEIKVISWKSLLSTLIIITMMEITLFLNAMMT